MTTKYILHGGFTKGEPQVNDPFYSEVLRDTPDEVNILLVYFAKNLDRIPDNSKEDIGEFTKNSNGKSLNFDIATEEDFKHQAARADVIYLHGGVSTKILDTMQQFASELPQLFAGKVVAGDSAGANILSKVFYSKAADKVLYGFELLPIKLICHYKEEFERELDGIESDLEVVRLNEFEFLVLYNNE